MPDPAALIQQFGPVAGPLILIAYMIWDRRKGKISELSDTVERIDENQQQVDKKLNVVGRVVQALSRSHDDIDHKRVNDALNDNGVQADDFRLNEEKVNNQRDVPEDKGVS